MPFPDWVEKHRKPGYEIKYYYYYRLEPRWDKERKKPVKKTGEYFGSIKPWGFVPKGARPKPRQRRNASTKSMEQPHGCARYLWTYLKC